MGNYHEIGHVCLCVCLSVSSLAPTVFKIASSYSTPMSPMDPSRNLSKMVEIGQRVCPPEVKVCNPPITVVYYWLSQSGLPLCYGKLAMNIKHDLPFVFEEV